MFVYMKKLFLAMLVGIVCVACSMQPSGAEEAAEDYVRSSFDGDFGTMWELTAPPKNMNGEAVDDSMLEVLKSGLKQQTVAASKIMQKNGIELVSITAEVEEYDSDTKIAKIKLIQELGGNPAELSKLPENPSTSTTYFRHTEDGWKFDMDYVMQLGGE